MPNTLQQLTKETKYLIWDYDGVIGNTLLQYARAYKEAYSSDETLEQIIKNHFIEKHKTPKHLGFEKKDAVDHLQFLIDIGVHIRKLGFQNFPEVVKEIREIKNSKMSIVSSASRETLQIGLSQDNIGAYFEHILGFEDGLSKTEKVQRICKDWGISIKDVNFITDTNSDVIELKPFLNPQKIYGCLWGWHGEMLNEVLPSSQILKKPSDIQSI
jgi:phosphoglycolate phosphatase-like HAD superfamily hydrolase